MVMVMVAEEEVQHMGGSVVCYACEVPARSLQLRHNDRSTTCTSLHLLLLVLFQMLSLGVLTCT